MHGLVRCKHERRCSRARGADVSFRDVKIKIPDRNETRDVSDVTHWKHGLRFEKNQKVEFLPPKKVDFRSSPRPCSGCRTWWGADGKIVYLSPYVEKQISNN